MGNPLYPNGRCDACGWGAREDNTCPNEDCTRYTPGEDDEPRSTLTAFKRTVHPGTVLYARNTYNPSPVANGPRTVVRVRAAKVQYEVAGVDSFYSDWPKARDVVKVTDTHVTYRLKDRRGCRACGVSNVQPYTAACTTPTGEHDLYDHTVTLSHTPIPTEPTP